MNISANGIALIKKFEGFSAAPYLCPAGKWTIGFGHVIPALRGDRELQMAASQIALDPRAKAGMTQEQAEQLLLQDLAPVEAALHRLVTAPLNQNQFDALCSLIYNIGVGAFAKSTLLKLLNTTNQQASTISQFSRWVYGGGKILPGLVARRKAEMALFDAL